MIIGESDKISLEDLTHFGVKGMRWGTRKNTSNSTTERVRQLNRKASKLDMNQVITGEGFLGSTFKKQYSRTMKKKS